MKKIVVIGAIALVVFSCVLAAGCTSTQTDPIEGQWICKDVDIGNGVIVDMYAVFNVDGSGSCILFQDDSLYQEETVVWTNIGDEAYQFDISAPGYGTYTTVYTLASDGLTMTDEGGRVWYKIPEITPLQETDGIIGTWSKISVKNGTMDENVFIIHGDGTGYWMRLADAPSLSFTRMRHQDFGRTGENTYVGICSAGRVYQMEYLPETDSLVIDGKSAFTRLDPIVGVWSGDSNKGGYTVTTIMKSDGTGITTTAYANGTAQICRLTWDPNDAGAYDIAFSDGDSAVYTLGSDRQSLSSSAGITKTKQFMDSYYLLPVTGAWYCAENDTAVILNGDATGTILTEGTVYPVTWDYQWKATDVIDFTIQYADGSAPSEWKYNLTSDALVSPQGAVYMHPSSTVDGKITLN